MATIVDSLRSEWDVNIFRGFEMHDQGQAYKFNRYIVFGVLRGALGKIGLLYVDTPKEFKHMMSVIENAEGNVVLIDELEAFRKLKNEKEKEK